MVPYISASYYLYFHNELGRDAFFLPLVIWWVIFKLLEVIYSIYGDILIFNPIGRFPFDWKNPVGYFWAATILSPCIFYCPVMVLCDIFFAFGVCCHLVAFTNDLNSEIEEFNEQSEINGNKTDFMNIFRSIVKFHSATKKLSSFSDRLWSLCKKCYLWTYFNILWFSDWFLISAKHKNTLIWCTLFG